MKQETEKIAPAPRALVLLAIASLTVLCAGSAARAQSPTPTPLWIPTGTNISPINTGNVGIGTTAPGFKLEVTGSASRNTVGLTGDGDSIGYVGLRFGAQTTTNIPNNRAAAFVLSMRKDTWYGGDGSGPSFIIETSTKGFGFAAPFVITPTNDILLNSGRGAGGPAGAVPSYGNVGIGTATPGARLDIGAGAAARGAYTDLLVGAGGNNPQLEFYGATKSSAITHDETAGGLVFYTNGPSFSPSFFVGNSGSVGVGTSTPSYKLDVQGGQLNASGGLCIAGDCRASWAQVAGGGTQWTTSGANIIYNSGNVGVGVGAGAPAARLSIGGAGANVYGTDLWVENNIHAQGNEPLTQGGRGRLRMGTAWGYAGLYADVSSTGAANDLILGSGSGKVRVGPGGTTPMNLLVPNGNVGIGNSAPGSQLFIGSGSPSVATLPGINVALAGNSYIAASNGTVNTFIGSDTSTYGIVGTLSNHPLGLRANNTLALTVMPGGSVGVGTSAPGFKLDVQGGKVNASDGLCMAGVCKATWAEVGGGGASQWTTSGSNISYSGGYVGIGTGATPPAELLEVSGSGEVKVRAVGTASAGIQFRSTGTSTWSEWQQFFGRLRLNTYDGTTTRPDVMTILPNGKVGIGKDTPTETLDVVGNIRATGSVSATYQDVAEWVPSTQKLAAGTVVVLDAARTNHVVASSGAYDTKVAGVVSVEPGVILGVAGDDKLKVATTGRVKVKVDATRGAIKVGDLLVTSEVEGVAMKSVEVDLGGVKIHRPGTIIGKALEPLEKGVGEILVLLSLQ